MGIIVLHSGDVGAVLSRLTGVDIWPRGRMRLADLGEIDEGLAVLLRNDWGQLMPHGGVRVMNKLVARLIELGCEYDAEPDAWRAYPEAGSELEARVLACVSRAASSCAVDLLLAQPRLWHAWWERCRSLSDEEKFAQGKAILELSERWDRLVTPASVVVAGQPNVGKSTLTNRVLGRGASVVADLPGTTRDWVGGLAQLALTVTGGGHNLMCQQGAGVAVGWLDTPGLRDSDDLIEQQAIELAVQVIEEADVLIAMRDTATDWPDVGSGLSKQPDLWVCNKADLRDGDKKDAVGSGEGRGPDEPMRISALTGDGVGALCEQVVACLGLANAVEPRLWAFCDDLRKLLEGGEWEEGLATLIGSGSTGT